MKRLWFGKTGVSVLSRVGAVSGLLVVMSVLAWQSTSCGVKTRLVPPPTRSDETDVDSDEVDPDVSPTPERVCDEDLGVCEDVILQEKNETE